MPKRFSTNISNRDLESRTAIDRVPLTSAQLCRISQTFDLPFRDEHNLRRRLRKLMESGLLKSWPYAIVSNGRAPQYHKLTRDGYRLLYGADAALPRRRYFEEISHGHHYHSFHLAESVVHLLVSGHRRGIEVRHFARENSIQLKAGRYTVYPDCAFQLVGADDRVFNFVVELDNGTERMQSKQDVESIQRKLLGYDAHQAQFAADDPSRYQVLFITTRGRYRLPKIMSLAEACMQNRQRTVFIGCDLATLLASDPFRDAILSDHRSLRRTIIPMSATTTKNTSTFMTNAVVA